MSPNGGRRAAINGQWLSSREQGIFSPCGCSTGGKDISCRAMGWSKVHAWWTPKGFEVPLLLTRGGTYSHPCSCGVSSSRPTRPTQGKAIQISFRCRLRILMSPCRTERLCLDALLDEYPSFPVPYHVFDSLYSTCSTPARNGKLKGLLCATVDTLRLIPYAIRSNSPGTRAMMTRGTFTSVYTHPPLHHHWHHVSQFLRSVSDWIEGCGSQ